MLTQPQLSILARALGGSARQEEQDGALVCPSGRVPVRGGIVRFRDDEGYAQNFAKQWKAFKLSQYDHVNGTTLTRDRFAAGTGWPLSDLDGSLVLEAGCGAGRFTRILAATGADLVSFDYSTAVEVSAEVNKEFPNVVFAQADILAMPFPEGSFDRVFCYGVLQHTPDPKASFDALDRVLKPGGYLAVDVYRREWKLSPTNSKYLWRWLTTRVSQDRLLAFLRWFIPKWLPIDTALKSIPGAGNWLGSIIPCWNYFRTALSPDQKVEWAILDTFDALAPAYDLPATVAEVEGWFRQRGYRDVHVRSGGNGVEGRGRKPE
jgi:SAM-dependent methyltransferase